MFSARRHVYPPPSSPVSIRLSTPCVYAACLYKCPKTSPIKYLRLIFLTFAERLTSSGQHETTSCPAHDVGDTVTGRDFGVVRRKSDVTYRSLLSSVHRSPVFATTGAIRFLCEWSFCVTQAFWHLSRYVVSWYYTPHTTITIRADLGPGTRRRERQRTLHGEIPCHFPNRYGFRPRLSWHIRGRLTFSE